MDLELQGKVVLLVGGQGSLGQACAKALRMEGAVVVVADRAAALSSDQQLQVELDVICESHVRAAIAEVVRRFERIDVLVTLAGVYQGGPISSISADDFQRVVQINLTGTFLVCREVLPILQRQDYGRIICIASLAGQVGGVVAGANYAASKAGVLSLVKSLARQSEKPWITVNAICPGPVKSAITDAWEPAQREEFRRKIPLGRFATPDEVAAAVAFLASPRAAYIHGAHLDLNGGAHMD